MKIASSGVSMESSRFDFSYTVRESRETEGAEQQGATLELSGESKGLLEQMKEERQKARQQQEEQEKKSVENWAARQREQARRVEQNPDRIKNAMDFKLEVLQRMLEALKRIQGKDGFFGGSGEIKSLPEEYRQANRTWRSQGFAVSGKLWAGSVTQSNGEVGTKSDGTQEQAGTKWDRTYVTSVFHSEAEFTAYQAKGVAKTEDGREIGFNVTVEMSRAFCERYETMTKEKYYWTDPLVINLDNNAASVSDQKFLFDIDCDGEEESISFAGSGSGFLALDKNGDGEINDGSELFGTASGNGFKDLADYDKDGNGWIDENDDIFDKLKIWTKDAQGKDRLISLRKADVGAIYLGYADTEFSLKELETNKTNGIIRGTGVYLKENGGVGTVQHVDLTI